MIKLNRREKRSLKYYCKSTIAKVKQVYENIGRYLQERDFIYKPIMCLYVCA